MYEYAITKFKLWESILAVEYNLMIYTQRSRPVAIFPIGEIYSIILI